MSTGPKWEAQNASSLSYQDLSLSLSNVKCVQLRILNVTFYFVYTLHSFFGRFIRHLFLSFSCATFAQIISSTAHPHPRPCQPCSLQAKIPSAITSGAKGVKELWGDIKNDCHLWSNLDFYIWDKDEHNLFEFKCSIQRQVQVFTLRAKVLVKCVLFLQTNSLVLNIFCLVKLSFCFYLDCLYLWQIYQM